MDTLDIIVRYVYTSLFVLMFFLSIYMLIKKTGELKRRERKELGFFDIDSILVMFALSVANFFSVHIRSDKAVLMPREFVIFTTLLLFWYIGVIVYSKRLNANEKENI